MKHMMLRLAVIGLLASGAACTQREESRSSEDLKTFDASEEAPVGSQANRAPGIVPTAAPGVAFAYRYGFRLPDANISAAQEAHAAACEKLGLIRCRITGMTYELDDRDRVNATLALAIDPLLARGFGRDAIAVIEKQDGRLRYAEITGEDQNPALDEAARREGSAKGNIAKLEADLAKARNENERAQLREQIRQLRAEIEMAQSATAESEAKIQRTPMTFAYAGGSVSGRGFAGENPVVEAWYLFVDSFATLIGFLLKGLAVVLPWLALVLMGVLLFRSRVGRGVRRWWSDTQAEAPPEA
jgi:hypothetical protein